MLNITSQYPLVIALLFLAISIAAAIFSFRKSHLSKQKKYALIVIRSIAYFLLLVLLLEPALLTLAKLGNETIDVVLIDNSRSNFLPGIQGNTKTGQVNELIENNTLITGNNRLFLFSNTIDAIPSGDNISLSYDGYETNISDALKTLKTTVTGQQVSSVTIISDGIITSGGNPVYEAKDFQTAFNVIGIGDTVQKKDVVVYDVLHNERGFTNTAVTIKVDLRSYESVNENINLHLQREGSTISSKSVLVKNNPALDEVTFDITESTPGFIKYRIIADAVNGELTTKNNYFDFIIEYIDNKTNILFISSGPGYDNALIESIFKRIKNYNITIRTAKNKTDFYEGGIDYRSFGELSAVFLLGFPEPGFNADVIKNIAAKCKEYNVPVIFFAQKNSDYRLLDIFEDLIPFSISRSSGESVTSLNIINPPGNNTNKLPNELNNSVQVFKNQVGIIQKPGSEVLMTERSGGEPIFITRNSEKTKSTAFLGYGMWRWRLNSRNNNESIAEKFIIETVNLSLIKDKKTKLRVYPVKSIFDYKESASFTAEVYDDEYKLTRNAVVTANVYSKDKKFSQKITFNAEENIFKASIPGLNVNDYIIEAEAEINKISFAKDDNRFLVDTLNTEYKNTRSDFSAMKELAHNTGGNFMTAAEYSPGLLKKIENPEPAMSHFHRNNLWENKFVLFLIIGLLTIEWVVKKRNNLP
ncbi:MAG: hypothetical protein EHM58_13175 [Ignavibacteriae bacterium]|nr:MAG: hypothetical protein EHM58_13175 [Ignavibacteriota bacterium]